jgi:hypothetical protein
LVFVQMTRTIPLRRTILQFSQIRRTLLLTFIYHLSSRPDRRIDHIIRKSRFSRGCRRPGNVRLSRRGALTG